MTGYLQRLAERAMGRSRPARAGSAAPFAPAPALAEEAVAVETPVTAGAFVSMEIPREHGEASPAARPPAGQERAAAPRASFVSGRRPGTQPSHDAVLATLGLPALDVPAASSRPVAALAGRAPSGASAALSDRAPDLPAMLPPPDAGRIPPLLPPAPLPRAGGAERALGHGPQEETTEVHVHIGRIEVTAVHEPAPAKPAGSRRPAPMALDDYLARRHGKRP